MKINSNFVDLSDNYLFCEIAKRVEEYRKENPYREIIKMGIGDVTLPLAKCVVEAMQNAVIEMSKKESFKGYGNEQGYDFLRESIRRYYALHNVKLNIEEIFISDGAKSDLGNILDLFEGNNKVLICDPVYPAYVEANIINGNEILFVETNEENKFLPVPNLNQKVDIIYLCSPNNPTGVVYDRNLLKLWVDYANSNQSLIIFDSAYESYIEDEDLPHSIFEIDGAENCAIEIASLSKNAGFTGVRCGYTIIPKTLTRNGMNLNRLWLRRQSTKFNGVSYITQVGANAVFSELGQKQIKENLDYYKNNAKLITDTFDKKGIWYVGGKNSPYVFMKTFDNMSSWEFFDFMLKELNIVGTPGVGFGKNGEGYFRLSAFSSYENTKKAMDRIGEYFDKK